MCNKIFHFAISFIHILLHHKAFPLNVQHMAQHTHTDQQHCIVFIVYFILNIISPVVSALYSESASSVLVILSTTLSEMDPLRACMCVCVHVHNKCSCFITFTFLACSSRFLCFSRASSRAFAFFSSLELSLSSI